MEEEEAATKTKTNQEAEEATEQQEINRMLVTEVAVVVEDAVEKTTTTEMTPNLTNKRKLKVQLKINSILCLEHQLPRTTKSR